MASRAMAFARTRFSPWSMQSEKALGCLEMPDERLPLEHKLPMDIVLASSVIGDGAYGFQGLRLCRDKVSESTISRGVRKHGLYREVVCDLGNGFIISHLISNGEPDNMFHQMQKEDCGLERLPMKQSVGKCLEIH